MPVSIDDPTPVPLGEIGSASLIANSPSVSAETVILTTTVEAGTDRRLKVEFTGLLNTDTAGDLVRIRLRNGTTTAGPVLAVGQRKLNTFGGPGQETVSFFARGVFTGTQSFCVTLSRASGSGQETVIATPTNPAVLLVTDNGG